MWLPTAMTAKPTSGSSLEASTQSDLGPYRAAWDALVETQPLPSPHLYSWWLEAGVQGEPVFIVVLDQGELVGGLALQKEKWRGVDRFRVMANQFWPAHIDLIAEQSQTAEVAAVLAQWMRSLGSSVFELRGLAAGSQLARIIPGIIAQEVTATAWCAPLYPDAGGFVANRSRSFRKEISHDRRRSIDVGYTARVASEANLDEILGSLHSLQQKQHGGSSLFLPLFDDFSVAARAGTSKGRMSIFELADRGGKAVAIEVCLSAGRRAASFINGRDPAAATGAGKVLLVDAMEYASAEGSEEFDLGSGFNSWKERWAPQRRDLVHVVAANGPRARATIRVRDSLVRLRRPKS